MNATAENVKRDDLFFVSLFRNALLKKLAQISDAKLTISDPIGETSLGAEDANLVAKLTILDNTFYSRVALGGSIAAAETYMDGLWYSDDLLKLVQIMVRNRELLDTIDSGLVGLGNKLLMLWHLGNRNTAMGSRKNIAAHYDLGNDFFNLFLDERMMYSSATFYQPDLSLEQAATLKLQRICEKMQLSAADHVLEIGSGWGGFAIYAAKEYGCKVTTTTISPAQFTATAQLVRAAGLEQQITVLQQDYRELQGKYDKLVSIEMIEAVGYQFLDSYLNICSNLLKSDGLALIQAITIEDWRYSKALRSVDFIQRYIFPGSFIPSVTAIINSLSRGSRLRLVNLEDQGDSYALTMNHWRQRFMSRLDKVREQGYSDEFIRMWEFYLAYCEGGFLEKSISNVQLLLAKPGNRRQQWLPLN